VTFAPLENFRTPTSPYRAVQILRLEAVDHADGYCNYPEVGEPKLASSPLYFRVLVRGFLNSQGLNPDGRL
jgi:hypothetical protein